MTAEHGSLDRTNIRDVNDLVSVHYERRGPNENGYFRARIGFSGEGVTGVAYASLRE